MSMEREVLLRVFVSGKPAEVPGRLRLSGNHEALGWWEPDRAVALKERHRNRWAADVMVPCGLDYELKVLAVHVDPNGVSTAAWEPGENRIVRVPPKAIAVHLMCQWGKTQQMQVFVEEPRFEADIDAMLRLPAPAMGEILMVGSSIFREWEAAPRDLAPLPVTNRAFGGSTTSDQLDRLDQIVVPAEPRVVVYYCGSNDVNAGVSSDTIAGNFAEFSRRVTASLPESHLVYVSINRCPEKTDRFDVVDAANRAAEAFCSRTDRHHYIDVNPGLFSADGTTPLYHLYRDDMLHFNPFAYPEVFVPAIKPRLQEIWAEASRGGGGSGEAASNVQPTPSPSRM